MKLLGELFSIESHSHDESKHDFQIRLNPDCFIYRAHFPGEPITPGVCILQIVLELLEKAVEQPLELSIARNVKFLRVITPAETPVLTCSLSKIVTEDSQVKVQAALSLDEETYAKLSLVCNPAR